jgi:hypothetical protein
MQYTLYKTTNIVNGKIYIGIHQTENAMDEYLGSGKLIKKAIKKYGKSSFQKEILGVFDSLNDARQAESQIVNEQLVNNPNTYNLGIGGGLGGENLNGLSFKGRSHTSESKKKISDARKLMGSTISENGLATIIKNNKENIKRRQKISAQLKGKDKDTVHKENISMAMKKYFSENTSPNKGVKKPVVKCPHCNKTGAAHVMSRWHFNNCKTCK